MILDFPQCIDGGCKLTSDESLVLTAMSYADGNPLPGVRWELSDPTPEGVLAISVEGGRAVISVNYSLLAYA